MKRAVHDHQKDQRRRDILQAAAQLIQARGYEHLTLAQVAQVLGLVKGTLYRYFDTKESLVLGVLEDLLAQWSQDLKDLLASPPPLNRLAQALVETVTRQPLLVPLIGIVHVDLEKNLSLERLLEFKRFMAGILGASVQILEACYPGLQGRAGAFILQFYAWIIGFGHLCQRSPAIDAALADPELTVFRMDFTQTLTGAMTQLLEGNLIL